MHCTVCNYTSCRLPDSGAPPCFPVWHAPPCARAVTGRSARSVLLGPACTQIRHKAAARLSIKIYACLERVGLWPLMAPAAESGAGCAAGPGGSGAGPAPPPAAPPWAGHGRAAGSGGPASTAAASAHASGAAGASSSFPCGGCLGAVQCCVGQQFPEPITSGTFYRVHWETSCML